MDKLRTIGTTYFCFYILQMVLELIATLKLDETFIAMLKFINIVLKFPKNLIDLLLQNVQYLQTIALVASFLCTLWTIYLVYHGEL